jgi:hypothetical protein
VKSGRIIAIAGTALVLAGCPSGATSSPTTKPAPTTTAAHVTTTTTAPKVQPYLLAITDLPTGWAVDNSTVAPASSCHSNPLTKVPSLSYSTDKFDQGGSTPELIEELGYFTDGAAAFSTINATLASCSQFTEQVGDQTVTGTMGVMSSPTYGDQSGAYTAELTIQGVSEAQGFVVVRKGNYVVAVALGDIGSVDTGTLDGFVGQALGKLPA